ncbi:MAG TPA: hypothetical protein VF109_08665, partial [Mycobacteriales bacterium]
VTGSAAWRLRVAAVVVAVGVVTALVVVGYLLGTQHSSGGNPTAGQNSGGVGGPPPRGDPPGPPPPDHDRSGGPPRIEVNQPAGDGDTIFVVYGRDLRPGTKLTVRLVGGPVSRVTPVVDEAGSFNYAVNQTHEFFPGRMPAGVHRVRVSTPDGRAYETTFSVHP